MTDHNKEIARYLECLHALYFHAAPVANGDIPCSEGYFNLRQKYSATEMMKQNDTLVAFQSENSDGMTEVYDAIFAILSYANNRLCNGEEDEWFDDYKDMFVEEPKEGEKS